MFNSLILGCGRSGTSMLAGSLYHSGYNIGGKGHDPNEGNPKGYFETKEVNGINDFILFNDPNTVFTEGSSHGWLSQFPPDKTPKIRTGLDPKMRELTWKHQPFVFKDPRFSYTLPNWRLFLPRNTKFICVFRDPREVVNSIIRNCQTAPYLSKIVITEQDCYNIWLSMYQHIIGTHIKYGDWLFLDYNQILHEDGLYSVEELLDAKIDRSFLDPSLQRAVNHGSMPEAVRAMYESLCCLASFGGANV